MKEIGIKSPTEIQQQAISVLLNNTTDFVGLAQTGTGKTAAFGLPLLHKIDPKKNNNEEINQIKIYGILC